MTQATQTLLARLEGLGKPVGFGRPQFKRYKADLRNQTQPLSSWIVPSFEEGTYEANDSLVSSTNKEGARQVAQIFGDRAFNYAKPASLIKGLLAQAIDSLDRDDAVLCGIEIRIASPGPRHRFHQADPGAVLRGTGCYFPIDTQTHPWLPAIGTPKQSPIAGPSTDLWQALSNRRSSPAVHRRKCARHQASPLCRPALR